MANTTEVSRAVDALVAYGIERHLIDPGDRVWARNSILETLRMDDYQFSPDSESAADISDEQLTEALELLVEDGLVRQVITEDTVVHRDLLDTAIMGRITPPPRYIRTCFRELHQNNPAAATDWYYQFSQDTNYIRRDRMKRDQHWLAATDYGDIDITINLAKPEKDPRAIAAARDLPPSGYPQCLLCCENEGYAGRVDHPARQNHRPIPLEIVGKPWFMQYSPYVYYNEHCIVFSADHTPMRVNRDTFAKLLDFTAKFPHYFVGSNADLPIVGGSILSHDHFQGGRFQFAMERAPVEQQLVFSGFEDIDAGIVRWPMSVLRLTADEPDRLIELADKILLSWREYSDPDAFIWAETDGQPHNTITPIARRRGDRFELDLVLRNNITTDEHPLGVYHPHSELHHLKKENIGLIEVMGLAVLPARLKTELAAVAEELVAGRDLHDNPITEKHAEWADSFRDRITPETAEVVIQEEVGKAFAKVLEHAGVYDRTDDGQRAFLRFVDFVNLQGTNT